MYNTCCSYLPLFLPSHSTLRHFTDNGQVQAYISLVSLRTYICGYFLCSYSFWYLALSYVFIIFINILILYLFCLVQLTIKIHFFWFFEDCFMFFCNHSSVLFSYMSLKRKDDLGERCFILFTNMLLSTLLILAVCRMHVICTL